MNSSHLSRRPQSASHKLARLLAAGLIAVTLTPKPSLACACGCGVFDVGTGTMLPTDAGGTVWLEYDYMNQNRNWSGTSSASSANNTDKQIETHFMTAGMQYMFSRSWGIEAEVPYWDRTFKTQTDMPNPGDVQSFNHSALGDIRIKGVYSGFSDDMSTGVTFGLKLASGDFTYPNFDRDTSIGTGSTDLLLGGYHMGTLPVGVPFNWFVNGEMDLPFITQQNYRPGTEFDAAAGVYYDGWNWGKDSKITPLLQLIGSVREHDGGINAAPDVNGVHQSGYQRLMISPGVEYDVDRVKLYGDVEIPVYQNVNGNQLTAPVLVKFIAGYSF